MAYAEINYGYSIAKLWGQFDKADVEGFFNRHAGECFGLRKSITNFQLNDFEAETELPKPWSKMEGASVVLMHNFPLNDTIVWDGDGNKIKSEWD
jgi:hypothetical protein